MATCVALAGALAAVIALAIGRGDFPVPLSEVVATLLGGGDPENRYIVMDLRLPRALTGLFVGAALGIAGAITQSVARNPLASPDILGVTAGASAAAVAVIVVGGGATGGIMHDVGLPVAALAGGSVTALLLIALARRGGMDGFRLILIGIGVGALLSALTTYLLVKADIREAARAVVWLTGSLNGRGWEHVVPVGLALAAVGGLAVVASFTLGALRLGDDTARSLGVRLQTGRTVIVLAAVALAAVATASAGPVAFVAFVAPQVALRLIGTAGPPIIGSALTGALMLLGSDLIARVVLPVELPVGIVTAAIGGPFLLYLLVRHNRRITG